MVERHGSDPLNPDRGSDDVSEVEEDTLENVMGLIEKYEKDLKQAGKLPPEDPEQLLFREENEIPIELEGEAFELFIVDIKSALAKVGLADPDQVTPEKFQVLDEETFLQLNARYAEALFFDTKMKTRAKLGHELITFDRILKQLQPPKNPSKPAKGIDLDKLYTEQKVEAFKKLYEMGVNPIELGRMLNGKPNDQQNLIRLAFLFDQETALQRFGSKMKEWSEKRGQPLDIAKVVKMSRIILRFHMQRRDKLRAEEEWDSIDHDLYLRIMHRMRSSMSIADLILRNVKINNIDEALDDILNGN